MKKWFLFLLALMLVLSSLGALAADTVDALSPYAEHSVSLPDGYNGMTSMAMAPSGAVVVAAKRTTGEWDLLSWQDLAGEPVIVPLTFDGEDIASIDIAPDGQVMAQVSNLSSFMRSVASDDSADAQTDKESTAATSNDNTGVLSSSVSGGQFSFAGSGLTTTIIWFAEDGTTGATFNLSGMTSAVKALADRRIAVYEYQSGLLIYDAAGTEVQRLESVQAQSFAASEEKLYAVTADEIIVYDLSSGQKDGVIPLSAGYSAQTATGPDGSLYVLNTEGVYHIDAGTNQATRIMSPIGTLLGDPGNSVSSFGVRADGTLAALLSSGGMSGAYGGRTMAFGSYGGSQESTLAYYTPLDPETVSAQTPFTITTLESSTRLRKAVSDFQRAHPELKVNLQVQMGENDETPVSDHIRTLNTDLLAGKGGDVLILDGLPMDNYAKRGILADITELISELGLLPNIVKGSANENGRIYAVPVQYSFKTLWGKANITNGVTALGDLLYGDLEPDQSPLSARTPEQWLRLFYPSSEASFKDGNGKLHFNTPEFESFLTTLFELYDAQDEMATLDNTMQFGGGGRGGSMNEMLAIYNGVAAFYPVEVSGLMQLSTAYSLAGGRESDFMTLPGMDGEGKAYTPSLIAGVNAQSGQRDLAMEFIRLLFSTDVQEADQMGGLPTTSASLDKVFDDAIERSKDENMGAFISIMGRLSMEIVQPDEQAWEALRALCESVDTPATIDETLMEFIISETADFFEGYISASEAAQDLEQRAWYYLNE